MSDASFDFDEWYDKFPVPARLDRAERTERLATESHWPLRLFARLILRVEARLAPPWYRLRRAVWRVFAAFAALVMWIVHLPVAGVLATRAAIGAAIRAALRAIPRPADVNGLIRPLQVTISCVAGVAIVAVFLSTGQGQADGMGSRAALHGKHGAIVDDPLHLRPATGKSGTPFAAGPLATPIVGAATTTPPLPPPDPRAAAKRMPLPVGKGMWLYVANASEGGDAARIVARAKANGLTHIYVRTGSSYDGFYAGPFLEQLLPVAHAGGVRVIGWDFPYLKNADDDVSRAVAAIMYTTATGQRLDGFTADVEPESGVNLSPSTAATYSNHLRRRVGWIYPLIAAVPRPNPALKHYPFAELIAPFDAVAPMVYWMGNDPAAALHEAVVALKGFRKPIIPVGQAYDGASEGGPKGVPSRAAIQRFVTAADQLGTIGVSFWSWQEADQQAWDAVRDAPQFALGRANPFTMQADQIRCYQALLASLGYPVGLTGVLDGPSLSALRQYQAAAHLTPNDFIDLPTQSALLTPLAAVR